MKTSSAETQLMKKLSLVQERYLSSFNALKILILTLQLDLLVDERRCRIRETTLVVTPHETLKWFKRKLTY